MNATNFTGDSINDTNQNPWVESGAMVYVAITVATMSAIIMCCTWFITQNEPFKKWRNGKAQYNGLDEEEEIQLTVNYTDNSEEKDAFTLEDSSSEEEQQNEEHQHEEGRPHEEEQEEQQNAV